jgi:hypothetical protein
VKIRVIRVKSVSLAAKKKNSPYYYMVYFEPFLRENCHESIKKALYLVKLDGNAASS